MNKVKKICCNFHFKNKKIRILSCIKIKQKKKWIRQIGKENVH